MAPVDICVSAMRTALYVIQQQCMHIEHRTLKYVVKLNVLMTKSHYCCLSQGLGVLVVNVVYPSLHWRNTYQPVWNPRCRIMVSPQCHYCVVTYNGLWICQNMHIPYSTNFSRVGSSLLIHHSLSANNFYLLCKAANSLLSKIFLSSILSAAKVLCQTFVLYGTG